MSENKEITKITTTTTVGQVNIGHFLVEKKNQLQAALPKHLKVDRLLRIAVTEINKIPKLKNCTLQSLLSAVIQCSQLGLEPGGVLGHAYLIPYDKFKKDGNSWTVEKTECQFMLGYRGMIDLARRSGHIISISAQAFYENDLLEFEYGINEKLKHIPDQGDRGQFLGTYAIAKLKDGGYQMELMYKNEIEKSRASSAQKKNKDGSPADGTVWALHYSEMARKTVLRRLFKYLPISIELADAMQLDYKADTGDQDIIVIDGMAETTEQLAEPGQQKSSAMAKRLSSKTTGETAAASVAQVNINPDDSWTREYDNAEIAGATV